MPTRTPDELIDLLDGADIQPRPDIHTDPRPWLREVLDVILPAYGQDLRGLIAAEIEAVVVLARRDQPSGEAKAEAYALAARIARGDSAWCTSGRR